MVFNTEEITSDNKKKAFLQIWGGDDMMVIYEHEGKVQETYTFDQAVNKITEALKGQINEVYPIYKLFCEMPQGKKSFSEWYPKVLDQAQLCNFDAYTPDKAARDAMTMQTENHKLRKYALAEGPEFDSFVKQGLALESATAQADKIEKAVTADRIHRIDHQDRGGMDNRNQANRNFRQQAKSTCDFCGYEPHKAHKKGKCPAKGKKCHICQEKHHFSHAKVCPGSPGNTTRRQ